METRSTTSTTERVGATQQGTPSLLATPEEIDAAIARLKGDIARLRRARELSQKRAQLRAELARLDQDIEGAIAGAGDDDGETADPEHQPPLPPPVAIRQPRVKAKSGRPPLTYRHDGRELTLQQWEAETGIGEATLRYRINAGWSEERIFSGAKHSRVGEAGERPSPELREPDHIDIDAKADGLTSGPALQKMLDDMAGKPVVLPSGMEFVFDPTAPAASVQELKAETVKRQRQGGKQRQVEFVTTASRNHAHVAVVDHFGDGQTKPDSTGHAHRIARWKMIEAHRHEHGLALTEASK